MHFILYVQDQQRSAQFYALALAAKPALDVPGMTQFELPGDALLGLMPEAGVRRLLGDVLPDPANANAAPRAELYLVVPDPMTALQRAVDGGARLLSEVQPRDWGHAAGYCLDPDGHVLAFAAELASTQDVLAEDAC